VCVVVRLDCELDVAQLPTALVGDVFLMRRVTALRADARTKLGGTVRERLVTVRCGDTSYTAAFTRQTVGCLVFV
jgi:hypothetical protein